MLCCKFKKKRKTVASRKTNCRLFCLWRANVLNGAKENYVIEWTVSSVNPVHGGISFLLPIWDGICYGFISALNTPGGDIFFIFLLFFSQQSWLFWIYGTNGGVAESGIYIRFCCITPIFFFFYPSTLTGLRRNFCCTPGGWKITSHQPPDAKWVG